MKNVVVCEGYHDLEKIKKAVPGIECIITDGSKVKPETLEMIKSLSKSANIIIMTDPDYPGERIRTIVQSVVPNAKHAFIKKENCISNNHKKVGIEHASISEIKEALDNVLSPTTKRNVITNNDLFNLGLNGDINSSLIRDEISKKLNIGKPNAKTFLNRINIMDLSYSELEELVCQIRKDIAVK